MLKGISASTTTVLGQSRGLVPYGAMRETPETKHEPVDQAQLDSKEFKILLKPSKFENVKKGIEKLWHKVEEAADEAGVKVIKAKSPEVRTQDIIFLDTEDHALKEQGFILRYRDIHGSSQDDNLTLKFRDNDRNRVAASDVSASPEHQAKAKFELDETFGENIGHIYSKSTKVKVPDLPTPSVDAMAGYFPALAQLGLDPSTELVTPHEGLLEKRHLLGNIKVAGGESAPAYLTLWYDEDHNQTPAVAEFSFAHVAHEAVSGIDQVSEDLMRNLRDDSPKWLSQGSTKTNFAYSE